MQMGDEAGRRHGRDAAIEILDQLLRELRASPVGWENSSLPTYLEALAAWIEDCPGYYRNNFNRDVPADGWEVICDALLAARSYE